MSLFAKRQCALICADPATQQITEHGDPTATGSQVFCNDGEAVLFYVLAGVVLLGALNWLAIALAGKDLVLAVVGSKKAARYVYALVGVCGLALVAMLAWVGGDKAKRCGTSLGGLDIEQ
jgi:uncharacterized membrane protein YuzA (DUF378 family)